MPHIFKAIQGGWSCALVGLAGAGLSNVLRFVCEPDVVASYLGAANTLLVYVEGDMLSETHELDRALARQITVSAKAFDWPRADLAALRSLANRSPAHGLGLEADEGLSAYLDYLCGPHGKGRRLVFAFDEFDQPFLRLPASGLRRLRALRDAYKYRLAYLVGTRVELTRLAGRRSPVEADVSKFTELSDQHRFPVRPYRPPDAQGLLARKTFNWVQLLSAEQADQLYRATGGHAKLLVAGLTCMADRLHLPWPNIERGLCAEGSLAEICREIWDDLDAGERAALGLLAEERRSEIALEDLAWLKLKGLVVGGPEFIFSTIFEAFVGAQREGALPSPPLADSGGGRETSKLRDPETKIYW